MYIFDGYCYRCEDVIEMTRNSAVKHEPLYPPLCWRDVEKDAHVLISSDIRIPQTQQVQAKPELTLSLL